MRKITQIKINRAYKEGKIYRVREILEGNIRSQPYDRKLYEEYGKLLYKLGDLRNAGKYLLLADNKEEKYRKAIDLFLNSYSPDQWWYLFPRKFKELPVNKLPDSIKNLMEEYPGFKISIIKYKTQNNTCNKEKENKKEVIIAVSIGLFFIFMLILGIIKFVELVFILITYFSS